MKYLLWIALTLAACGKSSDRPAGSKAPLPAESVASAQAAAADTGPKDRCEIHVTGAETLDFVGIRPRGSPDGKISVGTEYWMTDEELRGALGTMNRIGGGKLSKAEIDRKVDEDMKKDPKLWLLMMNCSNDEVFLNLSASNSSKSRDIPFGPHTYVVRDEPKAGEFGGMFVIKRGKHASYSFTGKLEITKFDASGLSATFAFEAGRDKSLTVKGSFDFGCSGRGCK